MEIGAKMYIQTEANLWINYRQRWEGPILEEAYSHQSSLALNQFLSNSKGASWWCGHLQQQVTHLDGPQSPFLSY